MRHRPPRRVLGSAVIALGLCACSADAPSADTEAPDASAGTSSASSTTVGGRDDEARPSTDPDADELLRAAQTGSATAVRELIAGGADPENPLIVTAPMVAAARNGHGTVVDELLVAGASPDPRGDGGALSAAAVGGYVEIVDDLLAAGADVDVVDSSGWTPLMWAAYGGHVATVEQLLDAGADPAVRTSGGGFADASALDIAADLGNDGAVELLSDE